MLFISGTMGLELDGKLAEGFEAQCDRVWQNIGATLKSAGMKFSNLAKLTVWLARKEDWRQAAQIRQRYLGDHKVAMSVVEVGFVDPSWLIEVEAIAVA
jgi:enamine deaminase RidA (YjgF/YER057c/UK114 family)